MTEVLEPPGFKHIWLRNFQIFINKLIFIIWTGLLIYTIGPYYSIREFLRHLQLFGFKKLDYKKEFDGIDLNGKVCIITGGTRGIGLEVCKYLLEKNCQIITGTSTLKDDAGDEMIEEKRQNLLSKINLSSSSNNIDNQIKVFPLDLSSMNSVVKFTEKIKMKYEKIDYLICNGGVMMVPFNLSNDKFEHHMAINYYGHCLLIAKLLTLLSNNEKPGRIIIVSSGAHHASFGLRLHDLNSIKLFSTYHSYCQSKLCQIMFTYQFNRWLCCQESGKLNVTINSLHPGMCRTGLMNAFYFIRFIGFIRESKLFRSAKEGTETILYTTLSPKIETISGKYFEDCYQQKSSLLSYDYHIQKQLWHKTWNDLRPWLTNEEIAKFSINFK